MSYLFSFSRYQTKCVIKFLFRQLIIRFYIKSRQGQYSSKAHTKINGIVIEQYTIFLTTVQYFYLTSYAKIISLLFFFSIFMTFYIGFTRAKKKNLKLISNNDIQNRIIEFKAKNKIIKMNRNHSNTDKKAQRVLKYREIEVKEVDNVLTGNKAVRLVPSKHLVVSNCLKSSGRYLQRNNFLSFMMYKTFSFSLVLKTSRIHFKNMLRTS